METIVKNHPTQKKVNYTINQLLDKLLMIETCDVTEELFTIKQNLDRMKLNHPKGGLIIPENSQQVMELINQTSK